MNKDISEIKFFITGGGTGGHIYPAVSVINGLIDEGVEKENIFYIGNEKNLEYKIAQQNEYNFLSTPVYGMPRKFNVEFIKWMFYLFVSILKSIYYVLKYNPGVIFATGGYVCAPILFAARFLEIPYILHDSDCCPGIVTRVFSKNATAVNLAFEEAEKYITSENICHFNNPVRADFFNKTRIEAREKLNIGKEFLILIMGGSQGAQSINKAAKKLIVHFAEKENIKIILQTGRKNYDDVINGLNIPSNVQIEPYFDDMSHPILAADLIISRAGSISISEILSAGVPSILVPYPYAASDHQRINARAIEAKRAAYYLEDDDLEKIVDVVENIILNPDELKENAKKCSENYKDSARKLTDLVLEYAIEPMGS